MRRVRRSPPQTAILLVLAIASFLAGCGSTKTVTVTKTTPAPAALTPRQQAQKVPGDALTTACPPSQGHMGCAVLPTPGSNSITPRAFSPRARISAGSPMFSDVSSWQGFVNWGSVAAWQRSHGWPTGGIFKMGEYHTDPYAASNANGTRGLSWRAGYWFVRNTGCTAEASQIISAARAYGLKVVWLDLEVPEARGYGLCLSPPIKRAGLIVGEYTAPGTNPGGVDTSDPLWEATYGSFFTSIWHPVVAWQCTDGTFGCRTYVPGIGYDDVSFDYGISKLGGEPPPPPDPFGVMARKVRHFGGDHAVEYNTARNWKVYRCAYPLRATRCKTTHNHLELLVDRLWHVAHHPLHDGKPTWDLYHRGTRLQIMRRELHPPAKH